MMKKLIALVLSICLVLGLCSCAESKAPEEKELKIKAAGDLTETEQYLLDQLSEKYQAKLTFDENNWDIILPVTENDLSEGLLVSKPYAKDYSLVEDEVSAPLVKLTSISYCLGTHNDPDSQLMDDINQLIDEALASGKLASLTAPEGFGQADKTSSSVYENNPSLTPVDYESSSLLTISSDLGSDYQDQLIIVCDSPNYWLKLFGLLKDGKNTTQIWTGPPGTQTFPYYKGFKLLDPYDGSGKVLVEMARTYQPKTMLIALGVNGIASRSEESFYSLYKSMITDIKDACQNTTIICNSIYPVTKDYKKLALINNEIITKGNSLILDIAEETGCYYLDTASVFWGEDGYAKPELIQKDGLHPNADGLTLALEYIRTHACIR